MCKKYDKCLTDAVGFKTSREPKFSCKDCEFEHTYMMPGELSVNDLVGSLRLLAVLFHPNLITYSHKDVSGFEF